MMRAKERQEATFDFLLTMYRRSEVEAFVASFKDARPAPKPPRDVRGMSSALLLAGGIPLLFLLYFLRRAEIRSQVCCQA